MDCDNVTLRVCFPFIGDSIGGSHISATHLIEGVPRDVVSPLVVLHQEGPLAEYLRGKGIPFEIGPDVRMVGPAPILLQVFTMIASAPKLMSFMSERGIDLVHTNDARMHLTWGLAARLAGAGFVWHQRSGEQSRRLALYTWLASRVLTVSEFNKSRLAGWMGRRAKVIYNPFEEPFPPPDRGTEKQRLLTELGAPKGTRTVGYIANLANRKRPLVFAEMAALLSHQTDFKLVFPMFGDPRPPFRQEVESRVRQLGLGGRCVLMGMRLPIEPWIAACDVIVAPGVDEPLGRAIIEPMIIGTPIVAADHGGNREILSHGETGLLVQPDDPAAFAAAVATLLEKPDFASRLAQAARVTARERFSRQQHVRTLLQVYREVMAGSVSRRNRAGWLKSTVARMREILMRKIW
jgi:glycosyltransferase involved in cell wall biosynthesis